MFTNMENVKSTLLAAFRYLLKPLVRLAMQHAVSFTEFSEALKKSYVDVAARQMINSGMRVTPEGISLIAAGVSAEDARDQLLAGDDRAFARAAQEKSPLAVVLHAWHTDAKYTGPYGVLLDLRFVSTDRSTPSFSDLVQAYCNDIQPRALLDELIRLGSVQEVGKGFYRAMSRSHVTDSLSPDKILYFARVVHNICETLEFNLRQKQKELGLIERSIFTQFGIPKKDHIAFDKFIRARGQTFSDDIDNWWTGRDVEGVEDGMQIGVGFYHYIVNEEDENALAKDLPK